MIVLKVMRSCMIVPKLKVTWEMPVTAGFLSRWRDAKRKMADHQVVWKKTGWCERWRSVRESLARVGPVFTLQTIIKNVFPARILHWGTLYFIDLDIRDWPAADYPTEGVRRAEPADADAFDIRLAMPVALSDYLNRGAFVGLYETVDGLAGAYALDGRSVDYYDWLRFELGANTIWGTDAWVAEGERGKRVMARLRSFMITELSQDGYERLVGTIDGQNISSLRGSLRQTNIAGIISYFVIFGLIFVSVNGRLQLGIWDSECRFVVKTDDLRAWPGERFGRYKANKVEQFVRAAGK